MNLAIKGHATRGKEVIEILEMLGGKNNGYNGCDQLFYYYIDNNDNIIGTTKLHIGKSFKIFALEEFIKKFPYKVGDKVKVCGDNLGVIISMRWEIDYVVYKVKLSKNGYETSKTSENLQPYKEETMGDRPDLLQQLKEYFENTPREVVEKEWHEYDKYNEIGPSVEEYLEYVSNIRQPQYPKTYEECCEIMGIEYPVVGGKPDGLGASTYRITAIRPLIYLLICRDAYWKIAGEQMGLGKPWKPNWDHNSEKYVIYPYRYLYFMGKERYRNAILAFPTAEMRDAFWENFKKPVELIRELL